MAAKAGAPGERGEAAGAGREDLVRSLVEIERAYEETLAGWIRAVDLRDHETEGHSRRVTELTVELARAFGLSGEALVNARRGALLHDVGKTALPDRVLLKPGPLDDEERSLVQRHPEFARDMLQGIDFLASALPIPLAHHERWDGKGYPRGLAGEEIPLEARLFAVVDVWDALRFDRAYRAGWPAERVAAHLRGESGKAFEPRVVEAFLQLLVRRGDLPG